MENIAKQYKAVGMFWLGIAIMLQFFVIQVVLPFLAQATTAKDSFGSFILFVLTNSGLYLIIAGAPLLWFEKAGWRRLNRRIYLHGKWNYKMTWYDPPTKHLNRVGQDKLRSLILRLNNNHGEVCITQSLFGISIHEGTGTLGSGPGAPRTTWTGVSVAVSDSGKVIIFFTSNLGGIKFNGVDDLTVSKRKKGEPIEMVGHCQLIQEPADSDFVIRGEITYFR